MISETEILHAARRAYESRPRFTVRDVYLELCNGKPRYARIGRSVVARDVSLHHISRVIVRHGYTVADHKGHGLTTYSLAGAEDGR